MTIACPVTTGIFAWKANAPAAIDAASLQPLFEAEAGRILNDATIERLVEQGLMEAKAGALKIGALSSGGAAPADRRRRRDDGRC